LKDLVRALVFNMKGSPEHNKAARNLGMAINMFLSDRILLRRRTVLLHPEEEDLVGEGCCGDSEVGILGNQVHPHKQHLTQRHKTGKLHAEEC
jgi:hypothetical protein